MKRTLVWSFHLLTLLVVPCLLAGVRPEIDCPKIGPWKIEMQPLAATEGGVEEYEIVLSSSAPAVPPAFSVSFERPQIDAHHKWVPARDTVAMPPNWSCSTSSRIASSLPLVAFLNDADANRQCVSVSEALRKVNIEAGLREEGSDIVWKVSFFSEREAPATSYSVRLRIDTREIYFGQAIREGVAWIERTGGFVPTVAPEAAFEPLYSTWYSFHQNVTDKAVEAECAEAVKMGMKVVIVDDGWQTDDNNRGYLYCGDWQVSTNRFSDMAAHVRRVHAMGMKYMVWFGVPMMGYKSRNYERFKGKYLWSQGDRWAGYSCLDPRFPEVRDYLAETFAGAVKDWDLDGLKLDFIDAIGFHGADPAEKENYRGRDIRLLSEAVDVLLREIATRVKAQKSEALIEFRQSYVGPAIRQYGNMMRAADCPGDLMVNRTRTANLRLTSGKSAVHADMLEWNLGETAEEAARFVLSVMFSTIQYSMMLRQIPVAHKRMIAHWIRFSQEHRGALLHGDFRPHNFAGNYPWIEGEDERELVIGIYQQDQCVPVRTLGKSVFLLNGSPADRIILDSSVERTGDAYDTFGQRIGAVDVKRGVGAVNVPKGGYVCFPMVQ